MYLTHMIYSGYKLIKLINLGRHMRIKSGWVLQPCVAHPLQRVDRTVLLPRGQTTRERLRSLRTAVRESPGRRYDDVTMT